MQSSASDSGPFTIEPVNPDDIPRLASIHSAAFKQDAFAQIMFDFDDAKHEATISDVLRSQLTEPTCMVVKAVMRPMGQIAGWMSFRRAVYSPPRSEENVSAAANADEKPKALGKSMMDSELVRWSQANSEAVQAAYFNPRGVRDHIRLNTLVVDPEWQGRGVGGALLRYCNAHADRDALPTWNRSSEVAYSLYARHGFETVDEISTVWSEWLDGDLLEQARALRNSERQRGTYMFRPVQGKRVEVE